MESTRRGSGRTWQSWHGIIECRDAPPEELAQAVFRVAEYERDRLVKKPRYPDVRDCR